MKTNESFDARFNEGKETLDETATSGDIFPYIGPVESLRPFSVFIIIIIIWVYLTVNVQGKLKVILFYLFQLKIQVYIELFSINVSFQQFEACSNSSFMLEEQKWLISKPISCGKFSIS